MEDTNIFVEATKSEWAEETLFGKIKHAYDKIDQLMRT